jgi:xanthine dehydrogenase YagR molybdenum-binding subunit
MAGSVWIGGGGGPPSTAIVRVFGDGSVNLNMGASDIGTGTKTVMAMVVAEELGVSPEQVQIEHADTGTTQFATASGGSKTVPTEAPAVRAAAAECRRQILDMASRHLGVPAEDLVLREGLVSSSKDPAKKSPLAEIPEFRTQQVVVGVGHRERNPQGKAISTFAAQFCEVEVNAGTGEVSVLRFAAAHDSGRVMNLKTYETQVQGGIAMGIGFGLTERRVLDAGATGKMLNANLHDYKLPTLRDVPLDITTVPVDPQDRECNSTGAKGLGEPATIPTAAAIANAVYHATGVRFTDTPINPTRLAELLAARKGQRGRRG